MTTPWLLIGWLLLLAAGAEAQPSVAANAGFDAYVRGVEARLAQEHTQSRTMLSFPNNAEAAQTKLQRGEFLIERMNTEEAAGELPGALLHDWRGTAFAPGATAADFERLLRDFTHYPQYFAPEVLSASSTSVDPNHLLARMRVRQKHVLTVVLDTTCDVRFEHLAAPNRSTSTSRSLQIYEISDAGTPSERPLSPATEHGFLWRLNTYWTYEEGDGGLYLQVESVSLSRSIPTGLAWAIRPFVESVPRESLEFTLRSARAALRNSPQEKRP